MRKLLGVLVVATLLIAGCGSGDDNKSENASANSDTTTAAANNSSGSGDLGDVCTARAGFAAPNPSSFSSGDAKETFKNIAKAMNTAKAKAPADIKADVTLLVDTSKPYFELLESHNFDFMAMAQDPSAQETLQDLSAKFQEAKVKAAQERVNAWFDAHCK